MLFIPRHRVLAQGSCWPHFLHSTPPSGPLFGSPGSPISWECGTSTHSSDALVHPRKRQQVHLSTILARNIVFAPDTYISSARSEAQGCVQDQDRAKRLRGSCGAIRFHFCAPAGSRETVPPGEALVAANTGTITRITASSKVSEEFGEWRLLGIERCSD